MEEKKVINPRVIPDDLRYEVSLRPKEFEDFVGQTRVKENLRVFIKAAKERGEALDHTLFYGPPGLGKTTLAYIIARELDVDIKTASGPVIEKAGDLAGLLTNLKKRDILFIDEIHRLSHTVEEYLYGAMEDFALSIVTGEGPRANTVRLTLEPFTLVGATTRTGLITSPLRSRFGISHRLSFYQPEELAKIIERSSKILNIEIEKKAAMEIARRSRGTPRIANRLLRRLRDYAQVKGKGIVTYEIANTSLEMLEVDEKGLDEMDKRILEAIIYKFSGGPVGLKTLAVAVGEEADTIEEVYEPYLVQEGYLKRTLKGRLATKHAYQHLGVSPKEKPQQELW